MTKAGTLPIRDPARQPDSAPVSASAEEIKQWLESTNPEAVVAAGKTYADAAKAIDTLVKALPGLAGKLAGVWSSDSSVSTQRALQMLHATGAELSFKMELLSKALKLYGETHLPEARKKIAAVPSGSLSSPALTLPNQGTADYGTGTSSSPAPTLPNQGTADYGTGTGPLDPAKAADPYGMKAARDKQAQEILQHLNEQIVTVYSSEIPIEVSYELPEVKLPGDLGSGKQYTLPSGGPYESIFGDRSGDGGGSSTGRGGDGGGDGRGTPGDTNGRNPGGGDTDKPGGSERPGDDKPGTDEPGSGEQPGDGDGNDNGRTDPGDGSQTPPSDGAPKDGTTPPVIGGEDKSTTPDARDTRETETSSVPPTITTTTTTPNPLVTTHTPITTNGSPGVPSVIGGSGGMNAQVATAGGAVRGATAGTGMMPFMPMGGGAGADGEQDFERTTYLSEDRDAWSAHHEVTTPVID